MSMGFDMLCIDSNRVSEVIWELSVDKTSAKTPKSLVVRLCSPPADSCGQNKKLKIDADTIFFAKTWWGKQVGLVCARLSICR